MALRVSGSKCRVAVSSAKENGDDVSHVFCESKLYGMRCRLEGIPGKKAYVLCSDCLQPVGLKKPRTKA